MKSGASRAEIEAHISERRNDRAFRDRLAATMLAERAVLERLRDGPQDGDDTPHDVERDDSRP